MEAKQRQLDDDARVARETAASLEARFGALEPEHAIALSCGRFEPGEVAVLSSFGADSAVLLHMISRIDPALPVVFLDTGKHFGEIIDYRDRLVADLGLTDIRVVRPQEAALRRADPTGDLHKSDTDACCAVRKVEPMARGLAPFRAWFTGRKRFQAGTRGVMPVFEAVGPRVRINPLARWTTADLADYMRRHDLRENPLVAYGYLSIGCFPCTQPAAPGSDPRSGRWAGQAKTECGIHLAGAEQSLAASSL
ncbi:phosphoadenylyl-sulfate reductase [Mesorhizobium microcysteis]|uniref:Adenosine 5'-phosphosulfate reductase n=1 Tax=Neoaquamicrobium microcysteis TaxID=2682781 RepID=A0A5D4GL67_9HYPH|nr:phosphoadenylyl-sulfate reductase [Mesorhizobium microcysteis]TYR29576.1 phosphoadenylyl-sulfate reductase [Mesorhizobium microcysteis]